LDLIFRFIPEIFDQAAYPYSTLVAVDNYGKSMPCQKHYPDFWGKYQPSIFSALLSLWLHLDDIASEYLKPILHFGNLSSTLTKQMKFKIG